MTVTPNLNFQCNIVLGAGEYARTKTENRPHIGKDGESIAELTKLGWFVMSPGQEFDRTRTELASRSMKNCADSMC